MSIANHNWKFWSLVFSLLESKVIFHVSFSRNFLIWGISEFNLEPKIHAFKTVTEQNCTIKVF